MRLRAAVEREISILAPPRLNEIMIKLLDDALEAVRDLPPDTQDSIAHVVLRLSGTDGESPVALSPEERTAIAASKAAAVRGDFATEDQMRAVWAKHGL